MIDQLNAEVFVVTYDRLKSGVRVSWQHLQSIPEFVQYLKQTLWEALFVPLLKMKTDLFDYTPIGEDVSTYQSLLETYLWVAICLQVDSWCYFLGRLILPYFFIKLQSVILAYIGLPLLAYHLLSKPYVAEEERRLYVLMVAILDGSLMGSVLSVNRLDFWPPPTAAMALSIAASTIIYEKQFYGCSRIVFICSAFVPGIMFCLLYGLIMGNLFDIRFLLWVGVLVGEAYVDIQLKLGRLRDKLPLNASDQAMSLSLFTFGVYVLIGTYSITNTTDSKALNAQSSEE